MFCSYCGTESTKGLNYCNRCGGNLAPLAQGAAQEPRAIVAPGAAWAAGLTTAAVVVIGLGMIFPITTELASRGGVGPAVVWIALFVALAVVACTSMLLRFWSALFGLGTGAAPGAQKAHALPDARATDTRELDTAARFDSLNPAPASSVTEQTTRTLQPEAVKRKQ